jgi:hypothetical protein
LASLQQRHPDIVEDMSRLGIDENESQGEAIEQLLLSLSVVGRFPRSPAYFLDPSLKKTSHTEGTPGVDMVVASMDVNGETRAAAVQSMLRTLREPTGLGSETLVGAFGHVLVQH